MATEQREESEAYTCLKDFSARLSCLAIFPDCHSLRTFPNNGTVGYERRVKDTEKQQAYNIP
jgi:hypothetical protein